MNSCGTDELFKSVSRRAMYVEARSCNHCSSGKTTITFSECRVFPGGKVRPGRDADPSPPSSAEVKNRLELYLYSP
jgi:hypothetical protein